MVGCWGCCVQPSPGTLLLPKQPAPLPHQTFIRPAGLTQTLNEFRQTTQQLQRLQSHEVRRLQAVERDGTVPGSKPSVASVADEPAAAGEAPPQQQHNGGGSSASDGGSASSVQLARSPRSPGSRAGVRRSVGGSPGGAAVAAAPAAQPSAQSVVAVRLAEQLEDVAGGADSGLLAEAAVALRELSRRDAELAAKEQVGLGCVGLGGRMGGNDLAAGWCAERLCERLLLLLLLLVQRASAPAALLPPPTPHIHHCLAAGLYLAAGRGGCAQE